MAAGLIKFDEFALDCNRYELLRAGRPLKLEKIPMELLILLVTKDGHLVTRQEIIEHLWGSDVFVDTEHGINTAIRKIRLALKDDPEQPRFVQTVTGKGYRFVAELINGNTTTNGSSIEPALAPSIYGHREPQRAGPESPARFFDPVNGHTGAAAPFDPQPKADSMTAVAPPTVAPKTRRWSWRMIAAFVSAALVCSSLGLYFYRGEKAARPRELTQFKPVPFTSFLGKEVSPTFSPDGSQIAFAWNGGAKGGTEKDNSDRGFDIYLKATGSETMVQLTHHPAEAISLSWSPDGAQIAFQRLAGSKSGLYLIPALGGSERRLRSTSTGPFGLSWSRDSKWIAFTDSTDAEGRHKLNLISVDSLETKPIPHMSECQDEGLPAFSPDGNRLAYFCIPHPGRFALYDIDPTGGSSHLIGRYAGWAAGMAWSQNMQKLIVARHVEGNKFSELDEIVVSNGQLQKLPFGETGAAPAMSPRGDKLAFDISHFTGADIWRRPLIGRAAPEKILASTQASLFPQYSPDGKHLAFMSNRTGTDEIWMSNADGTGLVQISKLNITGTPRWSPDGRKIVFDSRSEGRPGVYIADTEERVPRKLRTNLEEMSQPFWSHDGKWIYFVAGTDSGRISRCPAEGGDAEVLSNQAGSFPYESVGGDRVYFVTSPVSNPVLMVISLSKPRSESKVEGIPGVNFANWTVAPKGIYFLPNNKGSLEYFDFGAKKVSHLMELSDEPVMGLSVSQDQRFIVYGRLQQADSDIMVVENWH